MAYTKHAIFRQSILIMLTLLLGGIFIAAMVRNPTERTCLMGIFAVYLLECGIIGWLGRGLLYKQIQSYKVTTVCCITGLLLVFLGCILYKNLYFLLILVPIVGAIFSILCSFKIIEINYKIDHQDSSLAEDDDSETLPKVKNLSRYPAWRGNLTIIADDYAVPRYVYENGVELKKPNPENGRIVGYRIGPELIIHEVTAPAKGWTKNDIELFIGYFGGRLLSHSEANILRKNWDRISDMRMAVGETPLPVPYFWYRGEYGVMSGHYREDFDETDPTESAIIVKR